MFSKYSDFFKKQVPFVSSIRKKILIGLIIGVFLSFIIIFLEPFDTNEYESNHKTLLLSGFGVLFFVIYLIQSALENIGYYKVNKIWKVSHEIISITLFFTISGTIIYVYNTKIINGLDYSIEGHWRYFKGIVLVFIPVFAPLLFYLRNKFGERIVPPAPNTITIRGANKNESLRLEKKALLYIKAFQNYIEICFLDADQKVSTQTFRQTLSNAHRQLPFLEKCHRSYLVNLSNIKNIQGNSQNAKITFTNTREQIPVSKGLYKNIKNKH